jgi:Cft2 family RNA processing exonuclease
VRVVREDGSVFLPCYPAGSVYDLIEALAGHLAAYGKQGVPLYFISPAAKPSLLYANIFGEWFVQESPGV